MDIWKLVPADSRDDICTGPCDAASGTHTILLSGGSVEAALLDPNLLADAGFGLPTGLSAPVAAIRSGRIEPESDDEIGRVEAARRTWAGEGRERFDAAWEDLRVEAESRGVGVWLRPHAGDVIGDVPALRAIASGAIPAGSGVLLEPAALLTESMIPDAADHFRRFIEPIESSGLVRAVLITNSDGETRTPIRDGGIDPDVLLGLARRISGWAPVAVLDGDEGLVAMK